MTALDTRFFCFMRVLCFCSVLLLCAMLLRSVVRCDGVSFCWDLVLIAVGTGEKEEGAGQRENLGAGECSEAAQLPHRAPGADASASG